MIPYFQSTQLSGPDHGEQAQAHVRSRSWLGPGNRSTSSALTVDAIMT